MQPVADNTNPLSVYLSHPDLLPEYIHTLTGICTQFYTVNNRSVLTSLNGSKVQYRTVSATSFSARGVQTAQLVNADGYATLNGFVSLGWGSAWLGPS
jgi:hypothetical protein